MERSGMEWVALQCPKCGAAVTYNGNDDVYFCSYCGLSFKLIPKAKTAPEHDPGERLELAIDAYGKGRYADAKRYYREAMEADRTDWEADFGIAACDMMLSTWRDYHGDGFRWAIEDAEKRIALLPEKDRHPAKVTLAGQIMEAAVYCNNKLLKKISDAWDHYGDYEETLYSFDAYEEDDEEKRLYLGYAEEPDVALDDAVRDCEEWLAHAAELVYEAVPDGVSLTGREINIMECFLNYVIGYSKHTDKSLDGKYGEQIGVYQAWMREHNPSYRFSEHYDLVL